MRDTADTISKILKEQIKNYSSILKQDDIGHVITVGDGIVELQQLKDFKEWLYSVNTYENNYYTPTYEECLESMGVDPAPSRPESSVAPMRLFFSSSRAP